MSETVQAARGYHFQRCRLRHVRLMNVTEVLNEETPVSDEDSLIRKPLDYSLGVLAEYGKAPKSVRPRSVLNRKDFRFGL